MEAGKWGRVASGLRNQQSGKDDSRFSPVGFSSCDLPERSKVSGDWRTGRQEGGCEVFGRRAGGDSGKTYLFTRSWLGSRIPAVAQHAYVHRSLAELRSARATWHENVELGS